MGVLNRCFRYSWRLVCYIKRLKSSFYDLFSRSKTWEYRGLQGVTEGYKRLQGVTRGYKGLHGVSRVDRGLQGVTVGYKGWRGVTRGFSGLQRVTGGYKGLRGVTKRYKGWQGVTRGYKGIQRVTKDYRNFFELERSQILFLGLFCIKIKVEEISNFWGKRWTNPFGKILILRFW